MREDAGLAPHAAHLQARRLQAHGPREKPSRMRQKRHSATLFFATALTALLPGQLAGASGLIFCGGPSGCRAIELEHGAAACAMTWCQAPAIRSQLRTLRELAKEVHGAIRAKRRQLTPF